MSQANGAKPVAENLAHDGNIDLGESLYWSIENYGKVDAEISFEKGGTRAELPTGMVREYPCIGDARYTGRVYVYFKAGAGEKRVTIIKITLSR